MATMHGAFTRIVIVGPTGCGKTTLAQRIANQYRHTLVDLDQFYWRENWQSAPSDKFLADIDDATRSGSWIVTGNYRETHPIVWPRADMIIWLDYPFSIVLYRLIRRTWRRLRDRETVCNGNHETWRRTLSRDSIFLWLLESFYRHRRYYAASLASIESTPTIIRIRHPREAKRILSTLA